MKLFKNSILIQVNPVMTDKRTPTYINELWAANQEIERLEKENERLTAENTRIRALVDEQAEDDGLWFVAQYAPEAYLQKALRRLHEVIEGKTGGEIARELVSTEHDQQERANEVCERLLRDEGIK